MTKDPVFRKMDDKIPLAFRLVNQIEDMILQGQLKDGDRLPPEREFADTVGVSRTVVREAVQILVTKGLLKSKHGVGTVVQKLTRDHIVRPITLFLKTHTKAVTAEQLYQVRQMMEVEIAGIAAQKADADDIAALEANLKRLENCNEDKELFPVIDDEFHCALAETTHNPLLVILIESIQELMINLNKQTATYPDIFRITLKSHKNIFDQIRRKKPQEARRAMKKTLGPCPELLQGSTALLGRHLASGISRPTWRLPSDHLQVAWKSDRACRCRWSCHRSL